MKFRISMSMVSSAFIILTCLVILDVVYNYYFAPAPLTYPNLPFKPTKVSIKRGEIIPLIVKRCNSSENVLSYSIYHKLENVKTEFEVLEISAALDPGCSTSTSPINQTPKTLPPGTYRIVAKSKVIGQFRDYTVPWTSGEFEVTE
jgi:hypothetical protein